MNLRVLSGVPWFCIEIFFHVQVFSSNFSFSRIFEICWRFFRLFRLNFNIWFHLPHSMSISREIFNIQLHLRRSTTISKIHLHLTIFIEALFDLDQLQLGSSSIWITINLHQTQFGSSSIWITLNLRQAQFGSALMILVVYSTTPSRMDDSFRMFPAHFIQAQCCCCFFLIQICSSRFSSLISTFSNICIINAILLSKSDHIYIVRNSLTTSLHFDIHIALSNSTIQFHHQTAKYSFYD